VSVLAPPEPPPSRGRTVVIVIASASAALIVAAAVTIVYLPRLFRHSLPHPPLHRVAQGTLPPDPSATASPRVRAAAASVVKLISTAPSCRRRFEGSGFVFARGQVMTAAHVVAGARSTTVSTSTGKKLEATVVRYDPGRDLAVLHVPGLTAPALPFTGARVDDSGVIMGYPKNRDLVETPARIHAVQNTRGPDIYHDRITTREVLFLTGSIAQGQSGGPLVATDGAVSGMVFAASLDSPNTSYALTAREVGHDADRTATAPVSTGGCAD
jgi:S1-C subfamily serine protease